MVIRNLTEDEISLLQSKSYRHKHLPSETRLALDKFRPGQGILLSHAEYSCKSSNACGIQQLLQRVSKKSLYRYRSGHTNGLGSDLMVVCVAKEATKP